MGKLKQLELGFEELQRRVSTLEDLFLNVAKWTDFQKPQFTEEEIVVDVINPEGFDEDVSLPVDPLSLIQPAEEDEIKIDFEAVETKIETDEKYEGENDITSLSDQLTTATKTFAALQLPIPSALPEAPHVSMKQLPKKPKKKKGKVTRRPPPPIFKCGRCPFFTKTRMGRNQHFKKHSKFHCYVCFKSYARDKDLENHIQKHTTEQPYKCHHCKFTSKFKPRLENHLILKHPRPIVEYLKFKNTTEIQCTLCPFKCKKPFDFNLHLRIHTTKRPFKCPYCSYAAAKTYRLKKHIRYMHSGIE